MASPLPLSDLAPDATAPADLKADVYRILETNRLACEYQPIVDVRDRSVWAYEALARFSLDGRAVAPDRVFEALRADRTLFFMLESRTKRFQMQHRPRDARLFVNVDPHVCELDYQLEHWLSAFADEPDLVVEIIENTGVTNVQAVRHFTDRLASAGVDVALDDVGGHDSLFSFELLEHCHVLKLDRRWLACCAQDPAYRRVVLGLLGFAHARGIASVLEGVETEADLSLAEELGVDYVQGFLFRGDFVTVQDTARILV